MNSEESMTIMLLVICIAFAWGYGNIAFIYIANYADAITINFWTSFTSLVLLNIPSILLLEAGAIVVWVFFLNEGLRESLPQTIPAGIAAWLFYFFMDYWEPPSSILLNGTVITDTLGWSGSSDVTMSYLFKGLGVPLDATWSFGPIIIQHSLYFCTYVIGPILILILSVALGGMAVLIRGFGGEEAIGELKS